MCLLPFICFVYLASPLLCAQLLLIFPLFLTKLQWIFIHIQNKFPGKGIAMSKGLYICQMLSNCSLVLHQFTFLPFACEMPDSPYSRLLSIIKLFSLQQSNMVLKIATFCSLVCICLIIMRLNIFLYIHLLYIYSTFSSSCLIDVL